MPLLNIGSESYGYRFDGADEKPVLMLSHSLGLDHAMWDEQVADLLPFFRILRYDIRGHGASTGLHGPRIRDAYGGVREHELRDAIGGMRREPLPNHPA